MQSLLSGLVAYWPLGGVEDVVGLRNDLTNVNTVTFVDGKVVNGANFVAGSSQRLRIADNPLLSAGDAYYYICAWVKQTTTNSGGRAISAKVSGTTYEFEFYMSNRVAGFYKEPTASASFGSALTQGNWGFIEGYHDPDANIIGICMDRGVDVTTATSTGMNDTAGDFWIGGNPYSGGAEFFDGVVCELGVWRGRIPTAQERNWLYNNGMGRTYPFDGRPAPLLTSRRGHGVMARRNRLTGHVV